MVQRAEETKCGGVVSDQQRGVTMGHDNRKNTFSGDRSAAIKRLRHLTKLACEHLPTVLTDKMDREMESGKGVA